MMRILHFTGSHVFEFSTVEYTSSRRICTLVPIFLPFFGIPEALKVYHSKHFVFQLSETEFRWKTRLERMRTISQPCFSGSGTLSLETRQLVFVEEAGFSQGVVKDFATMKAQRLMGSIYIGTILPHSRLELTRNERRVPSTSCGNY